MQTVRTIANTVSSEKFLKLLAHDIVRMAVESEGLENWLKKHSGTLTAPGRATRKYAQSLFREDADAALLNTHMSLHIDHFSKTTCHLFHSFR